MAGALALALALAVGPSVAHAHNATAVVNEYGNVLIQGISTRIKAELTTLAVTCDTEEEMRAVMLAAVQANPMDAPKLIRAVFHDAIDMDNMLEVKDGEWVPMEGQQGGVDSCLLSVVEEGATEKPAPLVPSHNRNIAGALKIAAKICEQFSAEDIPLEQCLPDALVLGAFVAVENAGGPHMTMKWGRKKGICQSSIECVKDSCDQKHALGFAPSLTKIDDPGHFRAAFEKIGFSPKEQVALMGAHTFGKLQVCAGGMNGIEKGPWCQKPAELVPPVTEGMMYPTCKPQIGVVSNCWVKGPPSQAALAAVNASLLQHADGKPKKEKQAKKADALKPVFEKRIEDGSGGTRMEAGFGDGGFWDHTPNKFDNEYFKLFAHESYDKKDTCCGKIKKGGCHRGGRPVKVIERAADGKALKGEMLGSDFCDMKWCRSDRKGRSHMKSLTTWHEEAHDFVKKGWRHGVTKRIVRLAGDWALLHEDTKAFVEEFANDEAAFKAAFAEAFEKVASMSHHPLSACVA